MTTSSASGGSASASPASCSTGAVAMCSSSAACCAPAQVASGRLEGGSWTGCAACVPAGMGGVAAGCPGMAAPAPGFGGDDRASPSTPCCSCSGLPHCAAAGGTRAGAVGTALQAPLAAGTAGRPNAPRPAVDAASWGAGMPLPSPRTVVLPLAPEPLPAGCAQPRPASLPCCPGQARPASVAASRAPARSSGSITCRMWEETAAAGLQTDARLQCWRRRWRRRRHHTSYPAAAAALCEQRVATTGGPAGGRLAGPAAAANTFKHPQQSTPTPAMY